MEESVCMNCNVRIIKIEMVTKNFGVGKVWMHQHQAGYPEFHEKPYSHCKLSVAVPVVKQVEGVDAGVYAKTLKFPKSEEQFLKMLNCQTCNGRYWNVKLGKWVATRETVGLVCQECGWDYGNEYELQDKKEEKND